MCFDDGLPMMFNQNIAGAAKQISTTLVKVSTELLTSQRSRHVSLLSVEQGPLTGDEGSLEAGRLK
jgi:hypothetical protein